MCLTKRIAPCKLCVGFSYLSDEMDEVEDKMENNKITEGEYLKKMDTMKYHYDEYTKYHKKNGCSDCMDDEPEVIEPEVIEIEVELFEWRGNQYLIGDPDLNVMRILYDIVSPHPEVGYVSSVGAVTIY